MKIFWFALAVILIIAVMYVVRLVIMKNGATDNPYTVTVIGIVLIGIAFLFIQCGDTFKAKAKIFNSGIEMEKKKSP